jgi:hypothetical protein
MTDFRQMNPAEKKQFLKALVGSGEITEKFVQEMKQEIELDRERQRKESAERQAIIDIQRRAEAEPIPRSGRLFRTDVTKAIVFWGTLSNEEISQLRDELKRDMNHYASLFGGLEGIDNAVLLIDQEIARRK